MSDTATGPDFSKAELIPVIAQDDETGDVLMLAYMNQTAWEETLRDGTGLLLQPQPAEIVAQRRRERQRSGSEEHLFRLRRGHDS